MIDSFRQDVRYALRAFGRRPGLVLAAVLTLALGTGANTAVFTVVDRALLRSLPYPDSGRVVMLWEREKDGGQSNTGYATFEDWRTRTHAFSSMAAASLWMPTLGGSGEPERVDGQRVTHDFFRTLGVTPALGRDFTAEEDVRGNHHAVILSDGLFQRRFGGDRSILNRSILIGDAPYTVVGVLPKSFESLIEPRAQLWAPLAYNDSLPFACRTCRHLRTVARLSPGVSLQAAVKEMDVLSDRLVAEHPGDYPAPGTIVRPLQAEIAGPVRPALIALLLAVAFVLLIACVNVANLLLSWAAERRREIAIRVALGASRARLVRRQVTESVLLSLAGGAVGLLLALWGAPWLLERVPAAVPRFGGVLIDLRVFSFTFFVSALTGVAFGLVPALAASRPRPAEALKSGAAGSTGGRQRLRQTLVAVEVGLALVLLAGAGLLVKSFVRLVSVDAGFDVTRVLTAEISTSGPRFGKDEAVVAFYEQVLEKVRALPGVESAGIVSQIPLGGNRDGFGMHIEERPLANESEAPDAERFSISPDYLKTMRIPLLLGRAFTADDRADTSLVVLINETFARRIWPGENPIGKRLKLGDPKIPWRTIVGVVGNVKHAGLDGAAAMQIYLPQSQFVDNTMILAVRSRTDPATLASGVRAAVHSVDAGQPVSKVATMKELVSASTAARRLTMTVFAAFAAAALLLSAVGIYGVISASVTQRTREIGIRMALGAPRSGILGLVMSRVAALTLAGGAAGLVLTLALSRSLRSLLFNVAPTDPATLLSVMVLLFTVALLAAFLPARRALRVDPAVALRSE